MLVLRPHLLLAFCWLLLIGVTRPAEAAAPAVPSGSITASASSELFASLTGAHLTADGSGLDGDLHHAHANGHDMWLTQAGGGGLAANNPAGTEGPAWILYEFSPPQQLERVLVWNHNQPGLTDRGLREVAIHWRDQSGGWHLLRHEELDRAPGAPDYPFGNQIALDDVPAAAILVTALPGTGNHGSDYYGLSAVRFHGSALPCFPDGLALGLLSLEVDSEYTEAFSPRPDGWLGSDVAYSIALDEDRLLWLFGDTFVGTSTGGRRDGGAAFLNSSIGIQDISEGEPGEIEFHWGPDNTSFFPHQAGTPGTFYWPTMGLMLQGELFIFCYSVDSGGGLGFCLVGTTLLRIPNPEDDPADWTVQASDFAAGGDSLSVHTAVHEIEGCVYFLGSQSRPGSGNVAILGRMEVADLLAGANGSNLEYYTGGEPEWDADPSKSVELFRPGVSETSLHHDPGLGYYFALTYDVFGPAIYLTWARELTGPWVQPVCLYNVPEHEAVSFAMISYAARIQPALSAPPGELLVSYATNALGAIAPLFTEEGFGIYHPRFIRVRLEPSILSTWIID